MQIKTGTASVTNGSTRVIASAGNDWTQATAGSLFGIPGQNAYYVVSTVSTPGVSLSGFWELTLTGNYAGTTAPATAYAISRDFTALGLPLLAYGDTNAAQIFSRAMAKIDAMFTTLPGNFTVSGSITGTGTLSMTTTTGPHQLFVTGPVFRDNVLALQNTTETTGTPKTITLVTTGTDTFTSAAHGFADGQLVRFATTGTLPAGLTAGRNYYIQFLSSSTFKVAKRKTIATPAAPVVDITTAGTGTLTVFSVTNGYSAVNFYAATDVAPGTATVYVNNVQGGDMVLETNPQPLSTDPPPSMLFRLDRDDGGGTLYAHNLLELDAVNLRTTIYSYLSNGPVGAVGVRVMPNGAGVLLNAATATLAAVVNCEIGGTLSGLAIQDRSVPANCVAGWVNNKVQIFASFTAGALDSNTGIQIDHNNVAFGACLRASVDNAYHLGLTGSRWQTVFAYTGNFTTGITTAGTLGVTGISTLGVVNTSGKLTISVANPQIDLNAPSGQCRMTFSRAGVIKWNFGNDSAGSGVNDFFVHDETNNRMCLNFSAAGVGSMNALAVGPTATPGTTMTRMKHGTAVLVAGTVTVSDGTITANTRILCNRMTDGGTVGTTTGYSVTRSAGVSFTITGKVSAGTTATADTSTMVYTLIEP